MQEAMFTDFKAQVTPRKRPRIHDDNIQEQAIDKFMPKFSKWCQQDSEEELEAIKEELMERIDYGSDACEIMSDLKSYNCWSVDRDLLDLIEDTQHEMWEVYHREVKKWVKEQYIELEHAVGTNVKAKQGLFDKEFVGEIIRLDPEEGTYLVFCEALGHVRESEPMKSGMRTTGTYVNCEDIVEVVHGNN